MAGIVPPSWSPRLLSVLRIAAAAVFITHGTQKLFGVPVAAPMPIPLMSLMGLAGILEAFGGALMLVGFLTRPVAFVLAGEMAVAYFMAHAPRGFWPLANGGEAAVLYCVIFLYIAAAGPGPWSLDAARRRA